MDYAEVLPVEEAFDFYNTDGETRQELVHGRVIDMAPPNRRHQRILGEVFLQIKNHIKSKGGDCEVYPAPFAVELFEDKDTIVEPDISVICDKDKLTERGCSGAPDWVVEIISPSNASHDYVRKLNLYLTAGVREYWIVDPTREMVFVYLFGDEPIQPETYTFSERVKAHIYDDLWIDFREA